MLCKLEVVNKLTENIGGEQIKYAEKRKRDARETNRKYRSGPGKRRYKEILSNREPVHEKFQSRLNACKDNSGKLIAGNDKILVH
jgi:hypothetical protein